MFPDINLLILALAGKQGTSHSCTSKLQNRPINYNFGTLIAPIQFSIRNQEDNAMGIKNLGWHRIFGLLAVMLVSGLLSVACKLPTDGDNSSSNSSSSGRITFTPKTVYNTVLTTAPVLTNTATGFTARGVGSRSLVSWTNHEAQNIYSWIKDFNPDLSTMVQGVDDSNFYSALNSTIGSLKTGLASTGDTTYPTPKLITSSSGLSIDAISI